MKTWENIKKISKPESYHFESVKGDYINKYKKYGIDILYDKKMKVYTISFFGDTIKGIYISPNSCHRLIHELAVEYMQYNRSYITYFLKSKDLR